MALLAVCLVMSTVEQLIVISSGHNSIRRPERISHIPGQIPFALAWLARSIYSAALLDRHQEILSDGPDRRFSSVPTAFTRGIARSSDIQTLNLQAVSVVVVSAWRGNGGVSARSFMYLRTSRVFTLSKDDVGSRCSLPVESPTSIIVMMSPTLEEMDSP